MEEDAAVLLGRRFSGLAAEVEAVLRQIREREARAGQLARDRYRARPPHNVFQRLPGRADFEYIKVPKKPPELCFGSKTERQVFPNIPQVLKPQSQPSQELDMGKPSSWKTPRSRLSSKIGTPMKDKRFPSTPVKK